MCVHTYQPLPWSVPYRTVPYRTEHTCTSPVAPCPLHAGPACTYRTKQVRREALCRVRWAYAFITLKYLLVRRYGVLYFILFPSAAQREMRAGLERWDGGGQLHQAQANGDGPQGNMTAREEKMRKWHNGQAIRRFSSGTTTMVPTG